MTFFNIFLTLLQQFALLNCRLYFFFGKPRIIKYFNKSGSEIFYIMIVYNQKTSTFFHITEYNHERLHPISSLKNRSLLSICWLRLLSNLSLKMVIFLCTKNTKAHHRTKRHSFQRLNLENFQDICKNTLFNYNDTSTFNFLRFSDSISS